MDTKATAASLIDRIRGPRDQRSSLQSERYNILTDNYDWYIQLKIEERFGTSTKAASELKGRFLDKSANIYKYMIRLLSVVYKEPPIRSFKLQRDSKLFDQACNVNDLDSAMERVNQITTACNECFVLPSVRNGELDFDIILPHTAEVHSDGRHLLAIVYPITVDGEEQYIYWDDQYKITFSKGGGAVDGPAPHQYGFCPIVTYRRARPVTGFFIGWEGQDLVHAFCDQIIGRSWINRISYVQSFTQVFREQDDGIGDQIGMVRDNPTFGPDSLPVGKFRTLDLKTDVRAQLEVLERKLQRVAANWGISAETLNQAKHTSGLEKLLSFSGLMEYRLQTIKHYRPVDKELMIKSCKIWNIDGGGEKFSNDPQPRINYAEPRLVESQMDQVSLQEKEEGIGASSPVDYVMSRDPDIKDRAEAMIIIKRNLKEQQVVQEHKRSFQVPENQDPEQKAAEGEMGGRPERQEPLEVSTELEEENNGDG